MIKFNRPVAGSGIAPMSVHEDAAAAPREVLHGRIVTMREGIVVVDGYVCIEGSFIRAVVPSPAVVPAEFRSITPVHTEGTIYPGLVDLHNHLAYSYLPLWNVPRRYCNRYQWRDDGRYAQDVKASFDLLNAHEGYPQAMVRFAECRQLFGGTTTGQGIGTNGKFSRRSHYKGLMRNIEQPIEEGFPAARSVLDEYDSAKVRSDLLPKLAEGHPFLYHLSEGTDGSSRAKFLNLKLDGDDWAIRGNLICIHCLGLHDGDFAQLKHAAGMVWSPTSNLLLYGKTCNMVAAVASGTQIAIGADWSPSGCKNLLGELKVARAVCAAQGAALSAQRLVEAVTCVPARMIGWGKYVGSIAAGMRADLLILAGATADPYDQLIDATEDQIRAVLIDGRIRLAETPRLAVGQPLSTEIVSVGGKSYVLDLAEPTDDGLAGLTFTRATAMLRHGLEFPEALAAAQPLVATMALHAGDHVRLVGDMDGDDIGAAPGEHLAAAAKQKPSLPPRMRLDEPTAIGDPSFGERIRANQNMPDHVKAVF